jgi:hypothetical protein
MIGARLTLPPGGPANARPACDFCNGPDGRWIHDAANVMMVATGPKGMARGTSLGAWISCNTCLLYVQRGDADGLADHVARSANGPALLMNLTSLAFRRNVFQQLYRPLLPKLQPARPLTIEIAERWQAAARDYRSDDEASARRLARTLEAS